MESSAELISARITKLNSIITGKYENFTKFDLIRRESLLDTLQILYEECCIETLQKHDKQIAKFVEKHKSTIQELKKLRINLCDFDIKTVIGRGHFGQIHIVKERQTGDVYAMKTIKKSECLQKDYFLTERDIMAFTESPWLTKLKYAFQDKMNLFFVMEYHPGGDLASLINRQGGTIPESAATFYLAELLLALQDLHKMGYIHRDIKPDNLLLDRCGHLKLIDFGSATRVSADGIVESGFPVGTPDYIAPEVLESITDKTNNCSNYNISCDYWSVGVVAYELTIGRTPFNGQTTSAIYGKIMNHKNYLKFPSDTLLTQSYISFITSLITDEKSRLKSSKIFEHSLFKNINFGSLKEQVPPYIPKVGAADDANNFSDIPKKHSGPSIDNFKRKTQFSGRNLPFIGFSFVHDLNNSTINEFFKQKNNNNRDELVKNLKYELEIVKKKMIDKDEYDKNLLNLERKLAEKSQKLENIESVRYKLEKDLASSIAESTALKRTLEIERKDRSELERKALDLIKSAKLKWEVSERNKIESFRLEIEQYKIKINELTSTNKMLNEQLKSAFHMENKHRESLRAVEKLSRKSVIGLESRLETVIIENEQTIHTLQSKLDRQLQEKQQLEKKIDELLDSKNVLQQKYDNTSKNYKDLQIQIEEAEFIIKELNVKVDELEDTSETIESYRTEIQEHKNQLATSQNIIKDLKKHVDKLSIENQTIAKYKIEIENLTTTITEHTQKIRDLESKLHVEQDKVHNLQNQLSDSANSTNNDTQELREMRTKLWRTDKEFNNCKIDKRILERELKDAQNLNKELSENVVKITKNLEEQKQSYDSAIVELGNINESLSMELIAVKENMKHLNEKLQDENMKIATEKSVVAELKQVIVGKKSKILELENEIHGLKSQISALDNSKIVYRRDKEAKIDECNKLKQEQQQLRNELENSKRQTQNAQLNWEALKEACTLLEGQVVEFEKMNQAIQVEKSQLSQNIEKLIADLCTAKQETQEAKKQTNEEKSLRLLSEAKNKRLQDEVESLRNDCECLQGQMEKFKQYSNELAEQLTISEEKISELDVIINSRQREIADYKRENKSIKEEISECITRINELKVSNFKQNIKIQELQDIRNNYLAQIGELEENLMSKVHYYEEKDLKDKSIINQQTKLIDYLHSKLDECSNKKRTLADKIFGSSSSSSKKENVNPVMQKNYKEIELQLQKQLNINRQLKEELAKLNSNRTNSLDRHKIVKPVARSATSIANTYSNLQPHSFQTKLSKQVLKCQQCSKQILLGHDMNLCLECNLTVHPNCLNLIKTYCNLNKQHQSIIEDWVHILHDNKWEKRFCRLTPTTFDIYRKQEDELLESIELKSGRIILEPSMDEISFPAAANLDISLIFQIEIVSNSLILRFGSLIEKQNWYKGFQQILANDQLENIVEFPNKIQVNCVIELTKNIFIIGTDEGLYSVYNKSLLKIEGLSDVYRVSSLSTTKTVLMISGPRSVLVSCDINHLINLTQCSTSIVKPTLNYQPIDLNKIDGFHFLSVSNDSRGIFSVATRKQLIIVNYQNADNYSYKILDTAQPVSCTLYAPETIIVGSDKFFEIDLLNYNVDEFLDYTDYELAEIKKCYEVGSCPLEIQQIKNNPKEYLICFSEIIVIVDEMGRFVRHAPYKLQSVPLNFFYIAPFLYVNYFDKIEFVRLDQDNSNNCTEIHLDNFRIIGYNSKGIYLNINNTVKYLNPRHILDDFSDIDDGDGTDLDQFSFTSSMVQSLDGHSTTTSDTEEYVKKVKFTNL